MPDDLHVASMDLADLTDDGLAFDTLATQLRVNALDMLADEFSDALTTTGMLTEPRLLAVLERLATMQNLETDLLLMLLDEAHSRGLTFELLEVPE